MTSKRTYRRRIRRLRDERHRLRIELDHLWAEYRLVTEQLRQAREKP